MNWLFRRREEAAPPRRPHARPMTLDAFACSTCGRTDLSEAGDWDPPICEECDAAINFELEEVEEDQDR